jgi:hypothetical protein
LIELDWIVSFIAMPLVPATFDYRCPIRVRVAWPGWIEVFESDSVTDVPSLATACADWCGSRYQDQSRRVCIFGRSALRLQVKLSRFITDAKGAHRIVGFKARGLHEKQIFADVRMTAMHGASQVAGRRRAKVLIDSAKPFFKQHVMVLIYEIAANFTYSSSLATWSR